MIIRNVCKSTEQKPKNFDFAKHHRVCMWLDETLTILTMYKFYNEHLFDYVNYSIVLAVCVSFRKANDCYDVEITSSTFN